MLFEFQVLTVPTADTPAEPVIVLSYDDRKYLFNCGEGSQRAIIGAGVPVRKIKDVFLTSGWSSHAGLAGIFLNITGFGGENKMGVHGPKNLAYYLATMRAGLHRDYRNSTRLDLTIEEYSSTLPPPFEDKNIIVQPVLAISDKDAKSEAAMRDETSEGDRARVQMVAQSVWSGDFLEHKGDGLWGAVKLSPKPEMPAKNTKKRKRDEGRSDKKEASPSPLPEAQQAVAGTPSPTKAQFVAFRRYMMDDLPDAFEPFSPAVSYFIQGKPLPGRFNPDKAKALGVPRGPLFARLQQGSAVELANGKTVQPEEVMGQPRLCPSVLLVSCPDIDFMDKLCSNPFWSTCTGDKRPSVIIHSCASEILREPTYIKFMASFGATVKHYFSSSDQGQDSIVYRAAARQTETLRKLSDDIYPSHTVSPVVPIIPREKFEYSAIDCSLLQSEFRIRPFPALSVQKLSPILSLTEEHNELLKQYEQDCEATKKKISDLKEQRTTSPRPGDHVEILMLGTSSAGPSNYRNVAGTLVMDSRANGFHTLLDCGENTIGQIRRALGTSTPSAMQALRLIYISHLHADHHLGLIGVIKAWLSYNTNNENKLFIVCPLKLGRSVLEYGNIDAELHLHRVVLINAYHCMSAWQNDTGNAQSASMQAYREMQEALPGLERLSTCPANHSDRATCVRLDHKDGWSVAFSGDTRPTSAFAKLAQGVSCMVHEATFEDDKLDEALKKNHSTVADALKIVQAAEAKTAILTHFSQRYARLPVLTPNQAASLSQREIGLAVDLMRVKIGDIWQLGHHYGPQLSLETGLQKLKIRADDEQKELDMLENPYDYSYTV